VAGIAENQPATIAAFLWKPDMAGILIIAHAPLASALRDCATHVYCGQPQRVEAIDVLPDTEPAVVLETARRALQAVSGDNGVLILTDIVGATPSNIASRLADPGRVRVLAGVNLPMLVRAICYRADSLDQLAVKALAGGAQGVLQLGSAAVQNQTTNHPDNHAAEGHPHHQ
jgi:PTS system mannose-specific IIA component